MSKVNVEINGLKFGLRVTPEVAIRLVETLQNVWVTAASAAGPTSDSACRARNEARDVFSELVTEITFTARHAACAEPINQGEPA